MRSSFMHTLVFGLALSGCAPTGEQEPLGSAPQALGVPVELLDIAYDDIAGGLTPCYSVPAGVHTAVTQGLAEFLFFFEADYTSAGEPVHVSSAFLMSSLAAEPYQPGFVTVELFVAGPAVDDIENGIVPCYSVSPVGLASTGGPGGPKPPIGDTISDSP